MAHLEEIEHAQKDLQAVLCLLTEKATSTEDMHAIFEEESWEDKRVAAIKLFDQEPYHSLCIVALWTAKLACEQSGSEKRSKKYSSLYIDFQQTNPRPPINWYHVAKALHRAPLTAAAPQRTIEALRLLANTLEKTRSEQCIQKVMHQAREQAEINYMINTNPFNPALHRLWPPRIHKGMSPHW